MSSSLAKLVIVVSVLNCQVIIAIWPLFIEALFFITTKISTLINFVLLSLHFFVAHIFVSTSTLIVRLFEFQVSNVLLSFFAIIESFSTKPLFQLFKVTFFFQLPLRILQLFANSILIYDQLTWTNLVLLVSVFLFCFWDHSHKTQRKIFAPGKIQK